MKYDKAYYKAKARADRAKGVRNNPTSGDFLGMVDRKLGHAYDEAWNDKDREIKQKEKGKKENSCFPESVHVLTPTGARSIAHFIRGDVVLSFDPLRNELVERIVSKTREHFPRRIWEVQFATGCESLRSTASHSILTQRGWTRIDKLVIGDSLVGIGARDFIVERVVPTGIDEKVYSLITTGEHNFVANGIVAHNFTFMRKTRAFLHRVLFDAYAERYGAFVPESP
jgi:hypothetical protein